MPKPNNRSFQIRSLIVPVFIPSILFSAGEASLFPILPATAERFGADLPMAGFIAGLVMIGTLFFDIPAARLVNRFGERNAMIAASLIASVGILLAGNATNLLVLGIGVFIAGAMNAVFGLARHGYLAETVPLDYRARSLSILGGMFRLGYFVGPLIGAVVVASLGLSATFWSAAIFCLAAAGLLLTTNADTMKNTPQSSAGSTFAVARRGIKGLATLGVASGILGALRAARTVGLPLWGLHIGLHPAQVSLFVAIAGALDFSLFYFSGQVMDRFGRRWAALPTLIGLAVSQFLLIMVTDATSFLVVALVMSLANGFGSGIILTIGADLAPPESRSEYLAAFRLLVDTGVASAPPFISVVAALSSLGIAMGAMGGISLIGAFLMWKYLPNRPTQLV